MPQPMGVEMRCSCELDMCSLYCLLRCGGAWSLVTMFECTIVVCARTALYETDRDTCKATKFSSDGVLLSLRRCCGLTSSAVAVAVVAEKLGPPVASACPDALTPLFASSPTPGTSTPRPR